MRYLSAILILLAIWAAPVFAQDVPDPEKLDSLTKAEKEAREKEAELAKRRQSVTAEITDLKKTLQKTAQQTRAFEREAQTLTEELAALEAENAALEAKLAYDRAGMMNLIASLQRLEASPPPEIISTPDDAISAAQAANLMSHLSGELRNRADTLALSLDDLQQAREQIAERQTALAANQTKLEKRSRETKSLVDRKAKLQKSIETEEVRAREDVKRLAAESATLRELIANFEAEIASISPRVKPGTKPRRSTGKQRIQSKPLSLPGGTKPFASAKGSMIRPITGKLLRNYGKGEKGLTYTGQSKGQVLAPYAGRVEFAGPFKNYDQVVILNVGGGYFILLTGLGEIYAETGDNVRIGEPIGLMPYKTGTPPALYIELRKDGTTINPVPWLEPRPVKSG
ncbi:murein hydrolase activator EnvC family protein [Litorimonas sp. RW-G-Af-16]|uniref:murein hydrolase activator EnvC family protein n=1 Tax=Litorimonas sp. RW-G-Af-16 TaxID=3241168 RepID=UPI00390CA263